MAEPSVTCPRCKMTSHLPMDIRDGFCSNCRDWTSPPAGQAQAARPTPKKRS